MRRFHFDQLDSTQLEARRRLDAGQTAPPFLISADVQTEGLGRDGHTWESPPGGCWFTLVWDCDRNADAARPTLGLRIGVACISVVQAACSHHQPRAEVRLKWPNDIFIDGRKVGGILTETTSVNDRTLAIVGIGINVNNQTDALPAELQPIATTLRDVCRTALDVDSLRDAIVHALTPELRRTEHDPLVIARAASLLYGIGELATIRIADVEQRGILRGLNPDGYPVVEPLPDDEAHHD